MIDEKLVTQVFLNAVDPNAPVSFRIESIGNLIITSGQIAASDPLVCPDPQPFTRRVPNGEYPVTLAIAILEGGDERVAFARVDFTQGPINHWEMAVINGQLVEDLQDDEMFGYGVDAGTGCFMDIDTSHALTKRMGENDRYFLDIIEFLDETYRHTWSWANFKPDPESAGNIVAFSSGYGDGFYASYFAIGGDHKPIALITDFAIIGNV